MSTILGALCTSVISSLVIGYYFIKYFHTWIASGIREYVPTSHAHKQGTPTLGGVYLLFVIMVNACLWCHHSMHYIWQIMCIMISFGAIGLVDDWYKLRYKKGITARQKFIMQWVVALSNTALLMYTEVLPTTIVIPGTPYALQVSLIFYLWAAFIMISTSNAVNLTDGLDGLATVASIPVVCFFIFLFSIPACVPYIASYYAAPLALFSAIIAGTLGGFLWHNSYPARLFMGDVGSLALGAGIAALALIAKAELLLPFLGIIFVVETVSVMIQVCMFRRYKKRFFLMAPLHHHFELRGMHETTITTRAALIAITIAILSAYFMNFMCA